MSDALAGRTARARPHRIAELEPVAPLDEDAVRQAIAAKFRLWAGAGHDLRQPLQAAVLFQHVLAQRNRDPALTDAILRLKQALDAQQSMIEGLIDLAKLEAGVVVARPAVFSLQHVLDRAAARFAPHARAAGLAFRMVPTRLAVRSDAWLVERMVAVLLSNALRYTERGRVLVGCRRALGMVRLQVWDTGIGIPPDGLGAIFEEFRQIDPPVGDHLKGLGVGLSIFNRLAELLGHPVAVRSIRGRGSLFQIEMPLA